MFSYNPFYACPFCVGRDADNPAAWMLVVGFVLLPFIVVFVTSALVKLEEKRKL